MRRKKDVPGARSRGRKGMTLVEVIVAIGLLGGVLFGMSAFSLKLAQASAVSRIRATASQLISDRLEQVKGAPRYSVIDSMYVATESNASGFTGYTRQTWVRRVGGTATDSVDYKLVTVEVRHIKLKEPLRKTTAIAPF
jgi:prepilin-type N-terminal cleavage/methylation domain-containing protein